MGGEDSVLVIPGQVDVGGMLGVRYREYAVEISGRCGAVDEINVGEIEGLITAEASNDTGVILGIVEREGAVAGPKSNVCT